MGDSWVGDPVTGSLEREIRRVAADVERSRVEAEAVVRHDTGTLAGAHWALAERWSAGLAGARAETDELADEVERRSRQHPRHAAGAPAPLRGPS